MNTWLKTAATLGALGLASTILPRYFWFGRRDFDSSHQLRLLLGKESAGLAIAHFRRGHSRLLITAHGFMRSMNDRRMVQLIDTLTRRYDVLSFDFRGHGRSEGVSDLNFGRSADDLRRVIDHAQGFYYERVGVVGYSMGAAAAILAAAQGAPVDAVVSVSCPTALPGRTDAERPHETWPWRWWAKAMDVRVADRITVGPWPDAYVDRIAPIPLLIVHDGLDTLVTRDGSERLFAAAKPPKDYLYVPWALHAMPMASVGHIMGWLDRTMSAGQIDATARIA